MEQIAFIIENTYIYWSSILRMLAVAAAVFCFLALYLPGKAGAAAVCVPLAVVLSLFCSRGAHWLFRPEMYESPGAALNLMESGGLALMGVFAGCLLAAVLVRLTGLTGNLPELLDCMSISGCLGIGLGRLGAWFNTTDRGMIFASDRWFPWVSAITNPVSGMEEYRLSVFLLQAAAAGALFLVLLIWYLAGRKRHRDGDATLIFLLCYGASQVLLDSMRYDPLNLRSNGFLRVAQLLGAGGILLAAVFFSVAMVSRRGWKKGYLLLWLVQAGCVAAAGWMEYYVQRHGDAAAMAYGVMGGALALLVGLTLGTRCLSEGIEGLKFRKNTGS